MQIFIGPGADSSQPTPSGFIVNHQTHLSDTKHRASKGHPNSHGLISPAERSLRLAHFANLLANLFANSVSLFALFKGTGVKFSFPNSSN